MSKDIRIETTVNISGVVTGYVRASGLLSSERQPVIDGLSLSLAAGDVVGLVGQNASGKTSFIRAIVDPRVRWSGSITASKQALQSSDIAYLPQAAGGTLSPWLTVGQEISFPLRIRSQRRLQWQPIVEGLVHSYAPTLPLDRRTSELSGGQRVMVALLLR